MLITTDDLNQEDWSLFEYFDKLKEEFPDFKLLAFFTPFWKEEEQDANWIMAEYNPQKIIKKEFLNFLLERSDWLSLGMHGLFHNKAEFSSNQGFQERMFKISYAIKQYLGEGIHFSSACKPPFYQYNETAVELAMRYKWDLYIQSGFIDFSEKKLYYRKDIDLIDSHVSTGCPMPDRIDKFYENLRLILKGTIKDKQEFHYG